MDARQIKAQQIVAAGRITRGNGYWLVPSQTGAARHKVIIDGLFPSCSCADFELTERACKHMLAVKLWVQEQTAVETVESPKPATEPPPAPPRKTYTQDWPKYNAAQTSEKDWFLKLLADLCRTIPEPERKNLRGRPIPMGDALFSAIFKVYSGFSARRFTCDLDDARERGLLSGRTPHFNSVLNVFESEAATPILHSLIAASAAPLREAETEFAVDSSGFCTSRFVRWFDVKYGAERTEAEWVKAHVCCGTRTNIITAAEILDPHAADSPQLPGLIEKTATAFRVQEVSADKAYAGNPNFEAVNRAGGTLYAAFRANTTGGVGGLFEKAFHFFCLHREDFLAHYHRRSMIETTFSMVKRKFGDSVRSKTDVAMKNEVLAKFVAHNLCCLVMAIYELDLSPVFGPQPVGPRDVLRFPTVA